MTAKETRKLKESLQKYNLNGTGILVLQDAAESVTEGGILLPEQNQHAPLRGTVVLVGEGKTIAVGNVVYFNAFVVTPIELEGTQFALMNEEDVSIYRK